MGHFMGNVAACIANSVAPSYKADCIQQPQMVVGSSTDVLSTWKDQGEISVSTFYICQENKQLWWHPTSLELDAAQCPAAGVSWHASVEHYQLLDREKRWKRCPHQWHTGDTLTSLVSKTEIGLLLGRPDCELEKFVFFQSLMNCITNVLTPALCILIMMSPIIIVL